MIKILDNIEVQTSLPLDNRSIVKTIADRDNINVNFRYIGMKVYVTDENKEYRLVKGTSNSDWEEIKFTINAAELHTDENHLTVNYIEKENWNNKAEKNHTHQLNEIIQSSTGRLVTDSQINEWNNKADRDHTHPVTHLNAYSKEEIDFKLLDKADKNHGNHLPIIQPTNNQMFLRNDNIWAPVTPENIGAQPKGNYLSTTGGTISGKLTVDGTILCKEDVITLSDKNLKENITHINYNDIIDNFMKINFCNFNLIGKNKKHAGVIAQEVKKLFPDTVVEIDQRINDRNILCVNYIELFAYMGSIIQEQEKRITDLEKLVKIAK